METPNEVNQAEAAHHTTSERMEQSHPNGVPGQLVEEPRPDLAPRRQRQEDASLDTIEYEQDPEEALSDVRPAHAPAV